MENWMHKKICSSYVHQKIASEVINHLIVIQRDAKRVLLSDNSWLVEFISCSYLGLDQDDRLIKACGRDLDKYGVSFHAARTRLQPENYLLLDDLLHQIYCGYYPVTFPSIHMAHQAIFPLLGSGEMPYYPISSRGILFILDRTAHASIQINRGLLQQFGCIETINYQDLNELNHAFQLADRQKVTPIAIADSIGSMGGATPPILQLLKMAEKYNGYVYLDDAHGTSIHGKNGCGYVLKSIGCRLHPRLIFCASLGKGFGALGGVLLLPHKKSMQFVKRFGLTYIFAGPPALPMINAAIASAKLHLSGEVEHLQERLWTNVAYFDAILGPYRFINAEMLLPIRGLIIGDERETIQCALDIKHQGFLVTTALYPTVPRGRGMLRIALSSAHTIEQIKALGNAIQSVYPQN